MKTETIHICEICGKRSPLKETIITCEQSHVKCMNIQRQNFIQTDKNNKYPYNIVVEMADGKNIEYFRKA